MLTRQLWAIVSALFLAFGFMVTISFNTHGQASTAVTIKEDGSVDPPTAPIFSSDHITYTLTGNISNDSDGLAVEKNGIVVDGAGHTIQGGLSGIGIRLSSTTNVTIKNINVDSFYNGIYLASSIHDTITGTNVTDSAWAGLELDSSPSNSINGNNLVNNTEGISLNYLSDNNSISRNDIISNTLGVYVYYSSGNRISHNNLVDNTDHVYSESSTNAWNDSYPSGGNHWSDYNGTDNKCGPGQDHPGSDGVGDTAYVIDSSNRDNYPLMQPWVPPDIAVTRLTPYKTLFTPGFPLPIYVYITNKGNKIEGFNVTVYANTTLVQREYLALNRNDSTTVTFSWNTVGLAEYKKYIISTYVGPLQGETHLFNNGLSSGPLTTVHEGDVNGDKKVNLVDVFAVALAFGSSPPDPRYNPNLDINDDGKINLKDYFATALNFGWQFQSA
jgi:parallel beta-helix repeat protein